MSERPWYRRFPDNFIAGTVGLSLEEKGAYSLVLDLIYVRGGPVPDEPRYIAGVCNCSVRKWNAIRQRLIDLGKIEVVDGGLDAKLAHIWANTSGRETIPAHIRRAVIDRDGTACVYCGDTVGPFHLDHVHPVSRGGRSTVGNLVVACVPCNLSKGARTPGEWLQ